MKNRLLSITIVLVAVTLFSCKKESFDYKIVEITADHVKSVRFSPNHYVLNADGKSTLTLNLELFNSASDQQYAGNIIPLERVNKSDYGYYYIDENDKEHKLDSKSLSFDSVSETKKIKVFAKYFSNETEKFEVEVRKPLGIGGAKKNIPIVFHLFQYTGLTNTEFALENYHIENKIKLLNNAFGRKISNGAVSVDSHIEFFMSEYNEFGAKLPVAGINKIKLSAKNIDLLSDVADYVTTVNNKQEFDWTKYFKSMGVMWDPSKYLNVWIIPVDKFTIPTSVPRYTIEGSTADIKGLDFTIVSNGFSAFKAEDIGIIINYNSFIADDFNFKIGSYFGLLPTVNTIIVDGDSDFCYDTFVYDKKATDERKFDIYKKLHFISDNIMDTKTSSISISNEQAKRIHSVLENCPGRGMIK